jgi:RNA polymerase sigma-70 factor, ECF subfamily
MATVLRVRRPTTGDPPGRLDPDSLLVARARRDPHAFAELYRRYVDPVYRYCHRRLGAREAAEDATAQVFSNALAALPGYRDDGPSFRSWLFAIAHNTIADDLRARRSVATLEEALDLADPAPSPESAAITAESGRFVHDLLAQLTPDQARIVELRLAGLTGPEVAQALGRNPNAVKVAQHRAYTRLRALLGVRSPREEGGDGHP